MSYVSSTMCMYCVCVFVCVCLVPTEPLTDGNDGNVGESCTFDGKFTCEMHKYKAIWIYRIYPHFMTASSEFRILSLSLSLTHVRFLPHIPPIQQHIYPCILYTRGAISTKNWGIIGYPIKQKQRTYRTNRRKNVETVKTELITALEQWNDWKKAFCSMWHGTNINSKS